MADEKDGIQLADEIVDKYGVKGFGDEFAHTNASATSGIADGLLAALSALEEYRTESHKFCINRARKDSRCATCKAADSLLQPSEPPKD